MLRVLVDLDLDDVLLGEKLLERKVGAEEEQQIGTVNGIVSAAVSEKSCHSDGVGVVVLEPLLAAKGVAHGGLELLRELDHFVAGVTAPVAAEDRDAARLVDHPGQRVEVRVRGAVERRRGARHLVRVGGGGGGRDVAGEGDHRRPPVDQRGEDGRIHDGPHLLRVD